jgi:NAD(P)-dependent dehydrogenase (short-subunit alcohol dehydrogenase family)
VVCSERMLTLPPSFFVQSFPVLPLFVPIHHVSSRHLYLCSGADAIVLIDLNQKDAEAAAKDLTEWFGMFSALAFISGAIYQRPTAFRRDANADWPESHGQASPGEITARGYGCDVSDEESVKRTFASIEQEFGKIDVRFACLRWMYCG